MPRRFPYLMRVVLLVGMVVDSVVGVALLMATHEPFPAYAVTGRTWGDPGGGSALGWSVDVINISSVLALTTADSPQAAYAASKAGILALTRVLAQEWTGRRGIRVNAIAPGFFATEMTAGHSQHLDQLTARIPAGRLGAPDDLSGAVVFLASEASSSVTGQMIVVDGGFVIT